MQWGSWSGEEVTSLISEVLTVLNNEKCKSAAWDGLLLITVRQLITKKNMHHMSGLQILQKLQAQCQPNLK